VHSLNCSNDLFPVAILLQPVVPIAATKILDYLAVPEDKTEATLLSDDEQVMGAVLSNSKSFVTFPKIHSERRKQ